MAVIIGFLTAIAQGFVNLLLAPYKAGTWFYGIMTADERAAEAAPQLQAMTAKLAESGELAAFDAVLKKQPDLVGAAQAAIEAATFNGDATALLEYARLKALAVEFPADDYIVNALIFGKSSDFFFMFFALVLTLLIAGLFYRPVLRSVAGGIDRFNGTLGKLASWFVLFMAFQQIMIIFLQQVFRSNGLPISFFGLELVPGDDVLTMPWFATELLLYNAIIIAFACAYTFMDEGHVRVDLIYGAMSRRVKHWIDVVGTLIFLMPSMIGLWWVSWHLAMNKIFQITSFNPLTQLILTRNFDGRIPGASSFKQINWNTSTGENFSHVPLYYLLILILAALMLIQAVGFLFSSLDKGLTSDTEHARREREDAANRGEADPEQLTAQAIQDATDAATDGTAPTTNASRPTLGSA